MDYWFETMQDDAYLIAADGWVAETHRVREVVKGGKKKGEMKDRGVGLRPDSQALYRCTLLCA